MLGTINWHTTCIQSAAGSPSRLITLSYPDIRRLGLDDKPVALMSFLGDLLEFDLFERHRTPPAGPPAICLSGK